MWSKYNMGAKFSDRDKAHREKEVCRQVHDGHL